MRTSDPDKINAIDRAMRARHPPAPPKKSHYPTGFVIDVVIDTKLPIKLEANEYGVVYRHVRLDDKNHVLYVSPQRWAEMGQKIPDDLLDKTTALLLTKTEPF